MELAPIAEPQLILYKDNASARAMELAPIAEPQLILYKDNASARAMELAPIAEPQLILYKDNASASAMELAPIAEPQLILCKDTEFYWKRQCMAYLCSAVGEFGDSFLFSSCCAVRRCAHGFVHDISRFIAFYRIWLLD